MTIDITPFIPDAQKLENQTGIPASVTLAQIIQESSSGGHLSGLATQGKNLFGIKGTGNNGSISMPTTEYVGGKPTTVQANFASYNSYYDSMVAHAQLLSSSRYAKFLSGAKSVNDYITGIVEGGYATDPNYGTNLSKVIQSNNLIKYDTGNLSFTPLSGSSSSSTTQNSGGLFSTMFDGILHAVFIILLFVGAFIFFLQAFPQTQDTIKKVVPLPV